MDLNANPSAKVLEVLARSQDSGTINRGDRSTLKAALLQPSPTEDDLFSINRLLYALRRGWIRVID